MVGEIYRAPRGGSARRTADPEVAQGGSAGGGQAQADTEMGTVQGGSISPLLANLYLHYVFDLWVKQWLKKEVPKER